MKPILFNADMVRAILSETKTQTRRPVKFKPSDGKCATDCKGPMPEKAWRDPGFPDERGQYSYQYLKVPCKDAAWQRVYCPYGAPGDGLYVRETVCIASGSVNSDGSIVHYRADADNKTRAIADEHRLWTPSIHMPRWASRITLEIKSVRVERIQDISEEDAKAEGVIPDSYRSAFASLWRSTYPGSWERNEWVWVVGFGRVTA